VHHGQFRVYLASRSPRRRELLKQIGIAFDVLLFREHWSRGADVDEHPAAGERPDQYVQRVAHAKAEVGWLRVQQRGLLRLPVLAADTEVCIDDKIFGKPANRDEAIGMLRELSGREHRVLSAVAVQLNDHFDLALSESRVRFRTLTDAEITQYVDVGESLDKAGGYAIQGRAAAFIPEIRGSYSGIMGLPLFETAQLIARLPRF
jgi:septum formation protein